MTEKYLSEVCEIQYGFPFDSAQFSTSEGMPLIRIRDVVRGYSETFTTEKYKDEYIVHENDLLIGMDGEFNIAKWGETPALLNQRVCRLFPLSEEVDKNYLFYFMPTALKQIEEKTPFVTVKHLSAKELNKIVVPLPSMEEQRRIAAVLDKVTDLIDKRRQQLDKLELLVKSRFVEMFGDTPNEKKTTIADICKIITDGTHQPPKFVNEGIPFLFVSNIVNNEICYDTEKFISEETYKELIKRTPIAKGDILLSTVGSYGHPAVVKTDKPFCFQRHIAYLKPNRDVVDSEYLRGAILSADIQKQIDENVKGIAQKTLNLSEIRKIKLPLPAMEEQQRFSAFAEQTNKLKSTIQQSLDKLEILKKALMQEYFL